MEEQFENPFYKEVVVKRIFFLLFFITLASQFSFAATPRLPKEVIKERQIKIIQHIRKALPGYGEAIVTDPRFTFEPRLVRRFNHIPPPKPPIPQQLKPKPSPRNNFDYVLSVWAKFRGSLFAEENETILKQAELQFGVPKEIIVGILDAETQFGDGTKGTFPIAASLYTIAVYRPDFQRPGWAEEELVIFLRTFERIGVDPLVEKGSWTGARGKPQFEPSSYENLAMHYDGSSCVDGAISSSPPDLSADNDTICSIGNYLHAMHWGESDASQTTALYRYNKCLAYGAAIRDFADYLAGRPNLHRYMLISERNRRNASKTRRSKRITRAAIK